MTKLEYVRAARNKYERIGAELRQRSDAAYFELKAACIEAAGVFPLEDVAAAADLTRERIRQWVAQAERDAPTLHRWPEEPEVHNVRYANHVFTLTLRSCANCGYTEGSLR